MARSLLRSLLPVAALMIYQANGQTCADACSKQTVAPKTQCQDECQRCASANKKKADANKCFNNYLKATKDNQVKQARDKADAAKNKCQGTSDAEERKKCFQMEAAQLTKPTAGMTATQRKEAFDNAKEFQRVYEKEEKSRKADDVKNKLMRASGADLEKEKRNMCGLCINGTENKERMKDFNEAKKRAAQKICIDKCVKDALKATEANELASCVNTSATKMENAQCFCKTKADDAQLMRISDDKGADKSKGATEYICSIYATCMENGEVDCKDTMSELLESAKDSCNSRGSKGMMQPMIRMNLPQLMEMCKEKQVKDSMEQCKNGLEGSSAKDIRECIAETTRLSKGQVKKLERQSLKSQMHEEFLTCKKCNRTASSDCPDMSECKSLTESFIKAQLNSSCAGNFMTLVEDGLALAEAETDGEDEVVQIAKKACEVIIRFKPGKGKCRPMGKMQWKLQKKMRMEGMKLEGVLGLAKNRNSTQVERYEDGSPVQESKMTFVVHTMSSMSMSVLSADGEPEPEMDMDDDAMVEAKCAMLSERITNATTMMMRRLSDLVESDVDEVDSAQATDSCLANDASCQAADLEADSDDDYDTEPTTMAPMDTTMAPMNTTMAATTAGGSGTTAGGDAAITTTGATATVEHTSQVSITLTNIAAVASEAALIAQIRTGMVNASGGGAGVTAKVEIKHINVVSVFKNLPQIVVDAIITAYVAMTSVARATVKVNGQGHSGDTGGRRLGADGERRLQSDATVTAKVTKTAGTDVVGATQTVAAAVTLDAMKTQLAATSSYDAASLATVALDPVTTELSVTAVTTGTATAPTVDAIKSSVGSSITAGGATVTSADVTTTTSNSTTTTSMDSIQEDHAPVASLMTVWAAACYAFMMG